MLFRIFVHMAALLPITHLLWDTWRGNLTVNPLQDWTFRTGDWALRLLVASLACTPIATIFGFKQASSVRRALGLYGFGYAVVHFFIFIGVDYRFAFDLIWDDLATKRYILVGLVALLIFMPLAITSTRAWMKRLGRQWKQLHKLTYIAVPLAVVHYIWLVKADLRDPLLYATIVAVLLLLRLPWVRTQISKLKYRRVFQKL
ncbi:MAG: protein-methionine-sulfoxide reductase heme-binding subunit MsrQ [Chloroflexota bacterium]|jgi:sulfoxide reductase heme-binding subunit YedZ|nr:sulfoxide reductase heme-binding subunit YedZ [Chloroflexota bacterium]